MSDDNRITSLIQELQGLHIRATEVILREIEETRGRQRTREDTARDHENFSTGNCIYMKNRIR